MRSQIVTVAEYLLNNALRTRPVQLDEVSVQEVTSQPALFGPTVDLSSYPRTQTHGCKEASSLSKSSRFGLEVQLDNALLEEFGFNWNLKNMKVKNGFCAREKCQTYNDYNYLFYYI